MEFAYPVISLGAESAFAAGMVSFLMNFIGGALVVLVIGGAYLIWKIKRGG